MTCFNLQKIMSSLFDAERYISKIGFKNTNKVLNISQTNTLVHAKKEFTLVLSLTTKLLGQVVDVLFNHFFKLSFHNRGDYHFHQAGQGNF